MPGYRHLTLTKPAPAPTCTSYAAVDCENFTADFFHQQLNNLIVYDASGATINAGQFSTMGVELEVRTRDFFGASLKGTYTHLIREADDPGITPKDFGSVAVNYMWHGYSANVNALIRGSLNVAGDDSDGRRRFVDALDLAGRRSDLHLQERRQIHIHALDFDRRLGAVEFHANAMPVAWAAIKALMASNRLHQSSESVLAS